MAKLVNHICDGCGVSHEHHELERHSNGRGSPIDLCTRCICRIVTKAIKANLVTLRSECDYCLGRGVVEYRNRGWLPCCRCGN